MVEFTYKEQNNNTKAMYTNKKHLECGQVSVALKSHF